MKPNTKKKIQIDMSDAEIEIDHPTGNSNTFDNFKKIKRSQRPRKGKSDMQFMLMCHVLLAGGVNTAQNPPFEVGAEDPRSGILKLASNGSQFPKCIKKKPESKEIHGER